MIDKPLTVLSLHGPVAAIIEGQRDPGTTNGPLSVRGAWLEDGAWLKGFTVRGATSGANSDGGGVFCRTVLSGVSGCILSNNAAHWNGGGVVRGTVLDSTFINNAASRSGGGASGSQLQRCVLLGNTALQTGGGLANGRAANCRFQNNAANNGGGAAGSVLRNSVILSNTAFSGAGTYQTDLVNSTVTANTAVTVAGGIMSGKLTNCIVWGNFTLNPTSLSNGTATLSFSCIAPPAAGAGNIAVNPQLVDGVHVATTSPCRSTGNTAVASGTDLDGEAWANPPSMGCDEVWESTLTGPLTVTASAAWPVVAAKGVLPLKGNVTGRATRVGWDFGDGMVLTNASLLYTSHIWTNAGNYTVTFTAFNVDHPSGVSATVPVQVVPLVPPVVAAGGLSGTNFTLSFPGQPGVTYVVQQTTNLVPPVTWQTLTTLTSTGQVMQVLDSKATNATRFYRTQVP